MFQKSGLLKLEKQLFINMLQHPSTRGAAEERRKVRNWKLICQLSMLKIMYWKLMCQGLALKSQTGYAFILKMLILTLSAILILLQPLTSLRTGQLSSSPLVVHPKERTRGQTPKVSVLWILILLCESAKSLSIYTYTHEQRFCCTGSLSNYNAE